MVKGKSVFRLQPIAHSRMWGGAGLAHQLGIAFTGENAGEITLAGGFTGRDTVVEGLKLPLSGLYAQYPELFGIDRDIFPLAVNLIDARQDLSVQVHPEDTYARRWEGCPGLAEAWVVLEAEKKAQVVVGHNAKSPEELQQAVRGNDWDNMLHRVPVRPGDFFFLPPGTVHAIGAGVKMFEITGPSDRVYRLHDYERCSEKRPLEVDKALSVITIPQRFTRARPKARPGGPQLWVTQYIDKPGTFSLTGLQVEGTGSWPLRSFAVVCVLKGKGRLNGQSLAAGDTLLLPCNTRTLKLDGSYMVMVCHYHE